MKNVVKLELFDGEKAIKSRVIEINEWYDGDFEEIDSEEYRSQNSVSLIKGTQYGEDGDIGEAWANYYDGLGRLIKAERYDSEYNLVDTEEFMYDQNGKILKKV